ncbi:MAG: hypothetical protein UY28_C0046G0007 [Candidatus Amesbacteria bacterium GW2011_GWB1_48_13]|uniref:Uncharacterized protein n=1 Tax=Candidatus Amesbacteria bacterium GW2011_GWB1_48_13 TaxID=1618362 RepID=A0A0G1XMW7_9BACT|nr:MAG: hypothetical protein UY28_C0046G0007 [Candidatus Amesbacteria bacterium GW2011_GWB1_48_13]
MNKSEKTEPLYPVRCLADPENFHCLNNCSLYLYALQKGKFFHPLPHTDPLRKDCVRVQSGEIKN